MLAAQRYFAVSQDVIFGVGERRIVKRLDVIFAIRILLGLMERAAAFFPTPQLWCVISPACGTLQRRLLSY